MFTGIIQGKGTLFEQRSSGAGKVFGLESDFLLDDPQEGESIAVNGVCLTAKKIQGQRFLVDVSPESLDRTNLGSLVPGSIVNLERALRLSDRLGGHIVSGHVDAVSRVESIKDIGKFVVFTFSVPEGLGRYIVEKGSITINGISLTVNSCDDTFFSVSIIPHTLQVTTLGSLAPGGVVNIEVDLIGKYVEKLLSFMGPEKRSQPITAGFLAENGFLK